MPLCVYTWELKRHQQQLSHILWSHKKLQDDDDDDHLRALLHAIERWIKNLFKKTSRRRRRLFDNTHLYLSVYFSVTRLMGGSAGGPMSNMSGLAACNVGDSKPMQFPLTQRRKRRVLFTQAQVSNSSSLISINKNNNCLVLKSTVAID